MSEWVEPDWKQVLLDLRRFIQHRLQTKYRRPVEEDVLTEGAAIAVARLYRWWCRERERSRPIGSLEAMMNRVANFVAIDVIRGLIRRGQTVPIDEGTTAAETPRPPVDAAGRMRYLMLAYFEREHAQCLELAPQFFENLRWQLVADAMGLKTDTVKQRWSRCVKVFEEFLGEHREVEEWIFGEES